MAGKNSSLPYLLALHTVDGLGPVRLKRVLEYFEDPKVAWNGQISEFNQLGIPQNVLEKLRTLRNSLDPEENLTQILKSGIKVISAFDEDYPQPLKQIYDPPVILYYKGELPKQKGFGVVGTRKITSYGKIVTEKLTRELVEAGFAIISGLASGVDTMAHRTALEAQGKTIAVLGGGLNKIFPPENFGLVQKITDGLGAVISEYPPDYPALSGNFPSRNRIIAGLSEAVLVTEAAEDSGSLITARLALDMGKDVFAVPGPITSKQSEGTATLIKQGAKLTSSVEDILEELGLERIRSLESRVEELNNLSNQEKQVLECLENEQKHIDELCRELKKPSPEISALLIKMEISGVVKSLGGGNYIKNIPM